MKLSIRAGSSRAPKFVPLIASLVFASACAADSIAAPESGQESVQPTSSVPETPSTPAPAGPSAPPVPAPTAPATSRFAGGRLYVDPGSNAADQVAAWRGARPAEAALLERIAGQPQAFWFAREWISDVRSAVDETVTAARSAGAMPVLVAYNITRRDCGLYSAGGARSANEYREWVRAFAAGLEGREAIVVLEPDALAGWECLSSAERAERADLLRGAVTVLGAGGAHVYIDAGNARWHGPAEVAARLREAGLANAAGFALNVSNFVADAETVAYGSAISSATGGAHFVFDSSRNGRGPAAGAEWCNPAGRGLGMAPTLNTGHALVDAVLWIKRPGESDGPCNGGPQAGAWWADYALGLIERASTRTTLAQ